MFSKMMELRDKPFPQEESVWGFIKTIIVLSLFVTLFLYIFRPFDIQDIEAGSFIICLGFGIVTFVISGLYEVVMVQLLHFKGEGASFTFGKWVLYIIGLMLCIGLANFFYICYWYNDIGWDFLPPMILGTIAIGVFPAVITGGAAVVQQEKKYQGIAEEINQTRERATSIDQSVSPRIYDIPVDRIRYIEALQNYVRISHITAADDEAIHTERATLKSILDHLEGSDIVKCHRSFLVNRKTIINASGNAQGLQLTLADTDREIPVSRSYVPLFR